MQRLHEDDVSGLILTLQLDYCHLMIPMEFDWTRQVVKVSETEFYPAETDIGWTDPRYNPKRNLCDGVLAWDERFPPGVVDSTKKEVGPYAYAGQYQQMPAPRGGGIFKEDWWQLWDQPNGKFPEVEYVIASVDSAFTEDEMNDPSGMVVLGIFRDENQKKRVIVLDAWRKHLEFSGPLVDPEPNESRASYVARTRPNWGLMEWVAHTCRRFNVDKLLIEAKASGISAAQELRKWHGTENWTVQLCQVKGDKVSRALGVQAVFSQEMVYAPDRDWAQTLIDDCKVFPRGKHKDMVDALTQGIRHLRDVGMLPSDADEITTAMARVTHKKKMAALYPV
jgi:predicted phage terminase large subunit-like protein